MSDKVKQPSVRFAGHADNWEQREVGELLTERNEQSPKSEDYPLMAFIAYEGVAPKGERYDRSSLVNDTENKLYKHTEKGDFIYSSNNLETGSIGLNNYGNACISPVYSIFSCTELSVPDFIGRRLCRKDFISEMVKWRQGVIYGQWRIHEDDFVKIKIEVPTIQEQKKIGQLLLSLDNLITLHQRKYDKLVNIKKSLLDKMFPKKGDVVPDVRFAGFTDVWEQRKLGELTDITTGKLDANAMVPDGEYDFYTCSLQVYKIDKYAFEGPAITVAGNGYVGCLHLADGKFNAYQRTYVLSNFKAEREYLYAEIGNKLPAKVNQEARNGNIPYIVMDMLTELKVTLPCEQEQRKLAALFSGLDRLITLHQRKLEKLENIKKAFLEKMFI